MEHPNSRDACCGTGIVAQVGICTDCPHALAEFRTHPDPAMAQLQRAVRQAGERMAALEQQILGFATHGHIAALEELVFANHTDTEKRIAALETTHIARSSDMPWMPLPVWGNGHQVSLYPVP